MYNPKNRYSRLSGRLCCMLYQFLVLVGNRQFFCCGGKFSLRTEKKRYSRLSGGCAINYDRKKKRYSRLSVGGAVLAITTEKKKDTVVCLAGARSITTGKKKIQSSVCWVRGSGNYDQKKKDSRLSDGLCCCIVFCSGGKFSLRPEEKTRYSRLLAGNWQFFCCGGKFSLRPEKKKIHYDRKKKDTVICLMGARFWRLRPKKKKDTVVCLAGCAVVSVFGSGGKLALFLLWREILRPEKKRYSRLSGGCAIIITTGKKKDTIVNIQFVLVQLKLKLIQIC